MPENTAPFNVWKSFRDAFCATLDAVDRKEWIRAWNTGPERTVFYERLLMPSVAVRFGGKLQPEKHRCDYAFLSEDGVPLVFAESENAQGTAGHEIECLCSLASPVKVLFISCEWQAYDKDRFLSSWIEIIQKHHQVINLDCVYVIIAGEWTQREDAVIRYSFDVILPNGELIEESFHETGALPV